MLTLGVLPRAWTTLLDGEESRAESLLWLPYHGNSNLFVNAPRSW